MCEFVAGDLGGSLPEPAWHLADQDPEGLEQTTDLVVGVARQQKLASEQVPF